mmetsp:Transcript_10094/g.61392  ORF Transcript_10094/g.61392 Transcript_10094/m.61392 type:complete len:163 (+) Transcript_10094:432-920(+)
MTIEKLVMEQCSMCWERGKDETGSTRNRPMQQILSSRLVHMVVQCLNYYFASDKRKQNKRKRKISRICTKKLLAEISHDGEHGRQLIDAPPITLKLPACWTKYIEPNAFSGTQAQGACTLAPSTIRHTNCFKVESGNSIRFQLPFNYSVYVKDTLHGKKRAR